MSTNPSTLRPSSTDAPSADWRIRNIAAGTTAATELDDLVAQLRQEHRRRPRLQEEFDRAGLP